MKIRLKPLDQQVIVITGATSGIGLATARLAAKRGARLMLIARSEPALQQLAVELAAAGGNAASMPVTADASAMSTSASSQVPTANELEDETETGANVHYAIADVGDAAQLEEAARQAIDCFGGFDTWINNAGISIFGQCTDVPLEEQRKLFDTNFWGVVHGSLIAARHLRTRGGALINLGSELSEFAIPLQGAYVASKHAVKGYTDALRLELMGDGAPVSVTLIKPASIHTLFVEHARNYLDAEPRLPAPVYAPEVVAETILHAAAHPERDMFVGGAARTMSAFAHQMPALFDRVMSRTGFRSQMTDRPPARADGLTEGTASLRERSGQPRYVFRSSLYTRAVMHRRGSAAVAAAAVLVGLSALSKARSLPRSRR
jgi:short-subunit dehydrogenase